MRIVFEKGQHNWYATAENCKPLYRGLLVVGGSIEAVVDQLPAAFADLRRAAGEEAFPQCEYCEKRHHSALACPEYVATQTKQTIG